MGRSLQHRILQAIPRHIINTLPHPPIGREARTLQQVRTSPSDKNFPREHPHRTKRNKSLPCTGGCSWGKFSVSEGGLEGESPLFQEGALSLQGLPPPPPENFRITHTFRAHNRRKRRVPMRFLWTDHLTPLPEHPLDTDITADVCVVGGGIAGILIAQELAARGADCVLLDATLPGAGITKGTTAVLTAQHDQLYCKLAKTYGRNTAAGVPARQPRGAGGRSGAWQQHIDCDLVTRPSVMYSRTGRDDAAPGSRVPARRSGSPPPTRPRPGLPFAAVDAVAYPGMAQFHPLRFLRASRAAVCGLLSGTMVRDSKPGDRGGTAAITDRGTRDGQNTAIVATHLPVRQPARAVFRPAVPAALLRHRVLRARPDLGCTAEDAGNAGGGFYLRSYGDLLLVGGGTHRTGRQRHRALRRSSDFVRAHFPGATGSTAAGRTRTA